MVKALSDGAFIGQFLWQNVGSRPEFKATKKASATVVTRNKGFDSFTVGIFARIGENCYFLDKNLLSQLTEYKFGDSITNTVHMSCPLEVPPTVALELARRTHGKNFDPEEIPSEAEDEEEEGHQETVPGNKHLSLHTGNPIHPQEGAMPPTPGPETAHMGQPVFPTEPGFVSTPFVTQEPARASSVNQASKVTKKAKVRNAPYPRPGIAKKRMTLSESEARQISEERQRLAMERSVSYDNAINTVAAGGGEVLFPEALPDPGEAVEEMLRSYEESKGQPGVDLV